MCLALVSLPVLRKTPVQGQLGGSVGEVSDFGSGHDLTVREFEPRVRLCADSSEPGAYFRFCGSLSLCPSPAHVLSLSKINKNIKKNYLSAYEVFLKLKKFSFYISFQFT